MTPEEKAKAQQYFDSYPNEKVIHETSDGQVFLPANYNDAINHQRRLTEKDAAAVMSTYHKKHLSMPESQEAGAVPDETWSEKSIAKWIADKAVKHIGLKTKEDMLKAVQQILEDEKDDQDGEEEEEEEDDDDLNFKPKVEEPKVEEPKAEEVKQPEAPAAEGTSTVDPAEAEFKALKPDSTWEKPNIVRWLNLYGEEANVNAKKDKLLELVAAVQKKQSEAGAAGQE